MERPQSPILVTFPVARRCAMTLRRGAAGAVRARSLALVPARLRGAWRRRAPAEVLRLSHSERDVLPLGEAGAGEVQAENGDVERQQHAHLPPAAGLGRRW